MNKLKTIRTASCFVAAGLLLSSCELLRHNQFPKLPLKPVPKEQESEQPAVVFEELHNKPLTDSQRSKVELYPGNDHLIPEPRSRSGKTAKSDGAGSYSLNFDDADLGEVAKVILGDILGQNYILSPKVAGKVTLQTTKALSRNELLPTLERVLRVNNAALIKEGSIYHIEPASEAVFKAGVGSGNGTGPSGHQTRVIPIRYVSVSDLVEVIKPLVQEKGIVSVDTTHNALVATGSDDELSRIMDLVDTFDIDILRGRSFGLFPLNHVAPEDLIKELEEVFSTQGKDGGGFFRFLAIDRLNAVLAITHQSRYLSMIENWVLRLDRASSASGGGVNVYKVQNMDAVELADTLNSIFTGAQKQSKSAKVAPGQTAATITNKQSSTSGRKTTARSGTGAQTGDASVSNVGEVRIIADQANNSIVTVATPQEYAVILPIIKQLDVLPLQVLIDATIVEVNLVDDLQYGIQWFLSNGNDAIANNPSSSLATLRDAAESAALAAATGGFSAIYSSGSVKALLRAQSSLDNINVISSPSLMVLNNQQAKINVGDQVPIQTSTLTNAVASGTGTGTGLAQAAQIQYLDTGVTLEVTPRVNANGMVIMEIKQIVSDPKTTTTGVTTSPTISKREIQSFVAVVDGETIVLGGLIKNNNTSNRNGIPWLHELPWIGPLFGATQKNNTKSELVVLITPRVVKSKQDSRVISDEFKRKLTGIYEIEPGEAAPAYPPMREGFGNPAL
ncbi:MAG: type II secretion system secretin GspD [Gammaproteobacteria bacterium]